MGRASKNGVKKFLQALERKDAPPVLKLYSTVTGVGIVVNAKRLRAWSKGVQIQDLWIDKKLVRILGGRFDELNTEHKLHILGISNKTRVRCAVFAMSFAEANEKMNTWKIAKSKKKTQSKITSAERKAFKLAAYEKDQDA